MSTYQRSTAATLRAVMIWLGTAAATATMAALSRCDLAAAQRPGAGFAAALVAGSSALATAACAVLLVGTTSVLAALCTGRVPRRVGPVRRMILAACGAAALAAVPAAAQASPGPPATAAGHHGPALGGLPLPDRAMGGTAAAGTTVVVRAGDSLWAIAGRRLPRGSPAGAVAAYSARIYAHNAHAIGSDPDLILPGQRLRLPPTTLDR